MSYCCSLGFSLSEVYSESVSYTSKLTNGAVIEIFNFGKSKQQEYMHIVSLIAKLTHKENCINKNACLSKIHRVIQLDKRKRGNFRETFRSSDFIIPTNDTIETPSPVEPVSVPEKKT
jgi:hypothetical protein